MDESTTRQSSQCFIHEALFTHLQHTLDNVIPGISYPSVKRNKNVSLKGKASSSYSQAVCISNSQMITEHLLKGVATPTMIIKEQLARLLEEYSGLSPPIV